MDGRDGIFHGAIARDQYHSNMGGDLFCQLQQFQPVNFGHFDVAEQQVEGLLPEQLGDRSIP